MNAWIDEKMAEWDRGRQERDMKLAKLLDDMQASGKVRGKKLEEEMQKFRDEFDAKVAESKKNGGRFILDQDDGQKAMEYHEYGEVTSAPAGRSTWNA